MTRRDLIALFGALLSGWHGMARAQQIGQIPRVGLLASSLLPPIQSFKTKLLELGYVDGKNLVMENRYAEGRDDRYPAFAAELAALPVDVIVAWGTPAALAAKRATTKIPTVVVAGDVFNTGIVENLARPEANITGFIAINVELEAKRIELLKEVVPELTRLAVLVNSRNPLNSINLDTARRIAQELSVTVEVFEVQSSRDVEAALRRLVASRPHAVLLASDILLLGNRKQIAEAMALHRIPAIYPFREYSDVGGFITYGANISILFQRAAEYVERILKGERPNNLPVQQATAFELVINRKAAAGLGLRVPPKVLVRADEVVE
jgi:putative ABC transport system substrate-binding protein